LPNHADFSLAEWLIVELHQRMIFKNSISGIVAMGLICAAVVSRGSAELPMMQEKEWLGYFTGIKNKDFKFGITPTGSAWLDVLSKKGDPMNQKLKVLVVFQVEQVMPDGKISQCAISPGTLESAQPAAVDSRQTIIRGKAKGDVSFEITVEKSRDGFLIGGRVVDPGKLAANPPRFAISFKIPEVYKDAKKDEKAMKDNGVELTLTDRKEVKLSTSESINAATDNINGPGITAAEITLSPYQGKSFIVAASPNSSMKISNPKVGPLHDGFTLTWRADAAKDTNGNARMSISMK
jgi:hypothetical protein